MADQYGPFAIDLPLKIRPGDKNPRDLSRVAGGRPAAAPRLWRWTAVWALWVRTQAVPSTASVFADSRAESDLRRRFRSALSLWLLLLTKSTMAKTVEDAEIILMSQRQDAGLNFRISVDNGRRS